MAMANVSATSIPDRLYFRIGDVASLVGVKPYVLRYWETEFPMITPQKSNTGQRVYRRTDVETVLVIKHLLYDQRYSIEGARRKIRELRKEGDLKTVKQDLVQKPSLSEQKIKEVRGLVRDLRSLAQTPINRLFSY